MIYKNDNFKQMKTDDNLMASLEKKWKRNKRNEMFKEKWKKYWSKK